MECSFKTSILDIRGLQISPQQQKRLGSNARIRVEFESHTNKHLQNVYSPSLSTCDASIISFAKSCIVLPMEHQKVNDATTAASPVSSCSSSTASHSMNPSVPDGEVYRLKFTLVLASKGALKEYSLGSTMMNLDEEVGLKRDIIMVLPIVKDLSESKFYTLDRYANIKKSKSGRWREVRSKIKSILHVNKSDVGDCSAPISLEAGSLIRLKVKRIYNNGAKTHGEYLDHLRELSLSMTQTFEQGDDVCEYEQKDGDNHYETDMNDENDDYMDDQMDDDGVRESEQKGRISSLQSFNGSHYRNRPSSHQRGSSSATSLFESIHSFITCASFCGGKGQFHYDEDGSYGSQSEDDSAYCGSEEGWDWFAEKDDISMLTEPTLEVNAQNHSNYGYITSPRS